MLRSTLAIAIITLSACAHPRMQTRAGVPLRQCSPGQVSYSTDTPELVKQLAEEGVEFWESFGYTIGNVTIRVADARTSSTRVHWHANGCIGKATITIAAKHLQLSPETLQRVIAHELGHSLGLDHVAGDMFPMSPVIR